MEIEIKTKQNGYVVTINGAIRRKGEFVFKNTEELYMLEFIGEVMLDRKMSVTFK